VVVLLGFMAMHSLKVCFILEVIGLIQLNYFCLIKLELPKCLEYSIVFASLSHLMLLLVIVTVITSFVVLMHSTFAYSDLTPSDH